MSTNWPFRSSLLQPPSPSSSFFLNLAKQNTNNLNLSSETQRYAFPRLQIPRPTYRPNEVPTVFYDNKSNGRGSNHLSHTNIHKYTSTTQPNRDRRKLTKRHSHGNSDDLDEKRIKKTRYDEEITNKMTDFHISPVTPMSHLHSQRVYNNSSQDMECVSDDDNDDLNDFRLHIHEDVRCNLQTQSILPPEILKQIQKPCMELVLWKPIETHIPPSLFTPHSNLDQQSQSNTNVQNNKNRNDLDPSSTLTLDDPDKLDLEVSMDL